jgi:hypothetical protein
LVRDARDFTVFCFGTAEAAQAFHERFGGELLPAAEKPGTLSNCGLAFDCLTPAHSPIGP